MMEQLVVKADYYKNVLYSIYKEGKANHLSDVTLKCGDSVFYGHKCILSTQSQYFNSLFQGNFSDSKDTEIDLAATIFGDDEKSFKQVLKFFYTGVADFSDIFALAKYASFFQIDSLWELCEKKLKKNVCIENCIKYYVFSKSVDYYKIVKATSALIPKRFHDHHIHQDEVLQLSPSSLCELLDIDCLSHSTAYDILEFIAKWILKDLTIERVNIGQQVLEALYVREQSQEDRIVGPKKSCVESYHRQIEGELNVSPELKDKIRPFAETFQSILNLLNKSDDIPSEETVLFTLSKRKKNDLSLFAKKGKYNTYDHFLTAKYERWRTAYDVCLYRPSTKLWYKVASIDKKPRFENYDYFLPMSSLLLPFSKRSCKLNYIDGKLMFSSRISDNILIYNCEEKKWDSLETEERTVFDLPKEDGVVYYFPPRQRDLSIIGNHICVWNETTFVIMVRANHSMDEDEENQNNISEIFFEIYQMDETSGEQVLLLASPEEPYESKRYLNDLTIWEGLRTFVVAKATKTMDEILVVCFLNHDSSSHSDISPMTEGCFPFVANIEDQSVHFFGSDASGKLAYQPSELFILEHTDGLLIAVNTDSSEDSCKVIASYKYHSKELNFIDGLRDPRKDFIEQYKKTEDSYEEREVPMVAGDSSLWYFRQRFLYHNDFHHVQFHQTEGEELDIETLEPTATELTPHPFTTLVTAVEAKVKTGILEDLKPCGFIG